MIMISPTRRKAGFSILGALALIAFTIVALFIYVPWITTPIETSPRTRMIANGTSIYKLVFAEIADVQAELYGGSMLALPQSKRNETTPELHFTNSTDYFVYLVTNDILPVNWSYFAGHKIKSASGKSNPGTFKSENNAWNAVTDLNVDDSGTPFLISRNLKEERLLTTSEKPTVEGPPYDNDQIIVIRIGGSGEALKKRDILWENINPTRAENIILTP